MFLRFRCALGALAGASALMASTASAQWLPGGSCGCNSAPAPVSYARPVSSCSTGACGAVSSVSCAPAMQAIPITQQCYRTVPVTEYQTVRERVRRPVTEVEYVEQPVTTYRPVTETRTVDVPVTTYQDVVEYRQVATNSGHWQTKYVPNQKMPACQYDPRNNVFGFMNRAGYMVRSAFTPNAVACREYVPQNCVAQVPVTHRVPQTCVQKQSYQVTKYVPEVTSRKVAVSKVRWVDDEVVALKPVTVMKTIASGTQTAWTYAPLGASVISSAPAAAHSTIGLGPTPDPISSKPSNSSNRTAVKPSDATDDRNEIDSRSSRSSGAIERTSPRQVVADSNPKLFVALKRRSTISEPDGYIKGDTVAVAVPESKPVSLPKGSWRSTKSTQVAADDMPLRFPAQAVAAAD